jgi:hypothetical protein
MIGLIIILCVFAVVAFVKEVSLYMVYGRFTKIPEDKLRECIQDSELNPYGTDQLSVSSDDVWYIIKIPLSFFSTYCICYRDNESRTVPNWSKQHKIIQERYNELKGEKKIY